jgi:hypothetical protein
MENGAMAMGPKLTAPILDSTMKHVPDFGFPTIAAMRRGRDDAMTPEQT